MNPLEDSIVALRPIAPDAAVQAAATASGRSTRRCRSARTMGFTGIDPTTGNPVTVTNQLVNFGWEYVWHCHLLGHEENDMMRPIVFQVSPSASTGVTASLVAGPAVSVKWTNHWTYPIATNLRLERATNSAFTANLTVLSTALAASATTYTDSAVTAGTTYYYRVRAENTISYSTWANSAGILVKVGPNAPSSLRTTSIGTNSVALRWNDNSTNESGFRVYRSPNGTTGWTLIASTASNVNFYTNTGLARLTTYYYYVVSWNASGVSAPSNILRVTTL